MAKRGRPKKVAAAVAKTPPSEGSTPTSGASSQPTAPNPEASAAKVPKAEPATASAPEPTVEQQAEIDKVFAAKQAEIREAVATILGGSGGAEVGTPSGNIEERQDFAQADHIPGTRRKDKTYVPESVYDERLRENKRLLDYSRFRYCMITQDDFVTYNMAGWKFCKYDGGAGSGFASGTPGHEGLTGTGDAVFTRTLDGRCLRGDCYLMYIPVRLWEEINAEDNRNAEESIQRPMGHFFNTAYNKGIRTRAEINSMDGESRVFE